MRRQMVTTCTMHNNLGNCFDMHGGLYKINKTNAFAHEILRMDFVGTEVANHYLNWQTRNRNKI